MKMIEGKHLGDWKLLPPKPGACQECAVTHDPKHPHNPQSMFYQYKFFNDNGHWPDWRNAMAHCDEEMRLKWTKVLTEYGIDVEAGEILPGTKRKEP